MLNPSSLETPGCMGCERSLLHWERGSGPSGRRSNECMCELLTKDACVLHVVHVVPRPVPGATTTFCASYVMSPMLSLGPHSASRASGASCASLHTNCDKKVPQIYMCVCVCVRVCVYIAPPLPKGKLPQPPRPRETNHKSTRPGLTHGALGSLTSLPPFTFPSLLPFLPPPLLLPLPPAVPLLDPLPQRRPSPPQHAPLPR